MGYGLEASSMYIGISRHASRGPLECSFEATWGPFRSLWGASSEALQRVWQRANAVDSREEQSRRGRRRGRRRRRRRGGGGGGLSMVSCGILGPNLVVDKTPLWEASWGLLGGLSGASWRYFWASRGPLGASWGPLGGLLGASWRPLGGILGGLLGPPGGFLGPRARKVNSDPPSWGPLGPSWAALRPSWGTLGGLLGRLGALLGRLGARQGRLGALLGAS